MERTAKRVNRFMTSSEQQTETHGSDLQTTKTENETKSLEESSRELKAFWESVVLKDTWCLELEILIQSFQDLPIKGNILDLTPDIHPVDFYVK
jgi:hypothetical protein